MTIDQYVNDAVALLKQLIATPSISRDESAAADIMEQAIRSYGYEPERIGNNLLIKSSSWDDNRPTILLNAHIDTVKPVSTWTRDPFTPTIEGDRLYGLGSNDCGGGLVSLLQVFRAVHSSQFTVHSANYIYLASCEEEVSGAGGIRAVLPSLPKVDVAIVGEPTGMQPAIAERGLMVIDGVAHGKSGHAARGEGINAIYQALDDLLFIRDYKFQRVSSLLGETKMQCTILNSGTQHNVVPDECRFTIDVRSNELYTNEEIFEFLQGKLKSDLQARSFHLYSSSLFSSEDDTSLRDYDTAQAPTIRGYATTIREQALYNKSQTSNLKPSLGSAAFTKREARLKEISNLFLRKFTELGMQPFGSPTLSDQALMRFPSFKLGPGESSRSHSADEYICISEIQHAIDTYLQLLA